MFLSIVRKSAFTRLEINKSNLSTQDEYTILFVDKDSGKLKIIEMYQSNGNIVSYHIEKIELDVKINDKEFIFKEEEGMEIIDLRF